jgi:hypothetical protein
VFWAFFLDENASDEDYKSGMESYLLWEFIVNAVLCTLVIILFKNKPTIPPR